MKTIWGHVLLLLLVGEGIPSALNAQSLRKLERSAINRTRITLVNGDTIQRFTTTRRQPRPRPDRFYYWQGQEHVLRTVGAYNGHLLDGPYQLTDRADHLLGAGMLKKGLKTGAWHKWRADGSLVSTSRWRRGRQRGRTITYDANSQPLPLAAPPTTTPIAVKAIAPKAPRWWQPVYWKVKFKHPKTAVAVPVTSTSPAVTPAAPKKKKGTQKATPSPAPPQKTGS